MRTLAFLTIVFLTVSQHVSALLSPFSQSVVEIEQILHHERLRDSLGEGDAIQEIHKTEHGYIVQTRNNQIIIDVVNVPSKVIGPQKFELRFHTPRSAGS